MTDGPTTHVRWTWLGYRRWLVAVNGREHYATCPRTTGDRHYRVLSCVKRVESPVTIAAGHEGHCEACGVQVRVGDHIALYADDVVVHERCPGSRERAQA